MDNQTGEPFYIGVTYDPKRRLTEHLGRSASSCVKPIVDQIKSIGHTVKLVVLENVPEWRNRKFIEERWYDVLHEYHWLSNGHAMPWKRTADRDFNASFREKHEAAMLACENHFFRDDPLWFIWNFWYLMHANTLPQYKGKWADWILRK